MQSIKIIFRNEKDNWQIQMAYSFSIVGIDNFSVFCSLPGRVYLGDDKKKKDSSENYFF